MAAELVFFDDSEEEMLETFAATLGASPNDAIRSALVFAATAVQATPEQAIVVSHTQTGEVHWVFRRVRSARHEMYRDAGELFHLLILFGLLGVVTLTCASAAADAVANRQWALVVIAAVALLGCLVICLELHQLHTPKPRRQRKPHKKAPKTDPGE